MNNDEILEKMHRLHLILADELKRICEKYNIEYFMIAGTLLGAVRHKGFIPWDDDMDFGMTRDNYERFLECCQTELDNERFFLQTDKNCKYYTFNFSKIRLNGTEVIEEFSSKVSTNQGIYIDIFPLDKVSNNKVKEKIQKKSFWFFRNLLWVKCGYGTPEKRKTIQYKIAKFLGHFFTISFLKKMKYKTITMARNEDAQRVVTSDGAYGLERETLNAKWIKKTREYKFEDRIYPGIADYEEYLPYLYGDYMQLPPEDERNHHERLSVNFGEYS